MKRLRLFAALLALALLLPVFCACESKTTRSSSFFLMDTVITVTLYRVTAKEASAAFTACRNLLGELDALWSRTSADGDVAKINRAEREVSGLDERTLDLLRISRDVSEKTGGAFDISVAPLADLWQSCGDADRLPTDAELSSALALLGSDLWEIDGDTVRKSSPEVALDLGGIGKGAAIDRLVELLEQRPELSGGLVSFGSNIAVFGSKPDGSDFRIGLRDPKNPDGTVGTVVLHPGEILSVSGDYERYVTIQNRNYHHILDPETGYPAESGLSSVAVIARSGALADALSTALFVLGKNQADSLLSSDTFSFQAAFISSSGDVTTTPDFDIY